MRHLRGLRYYRFPSDKEVKSFYVVLVFIVQFVDVIVLFIVYGPHLLQSVPDNLMSPLYGRESR